MRYLLQFHITYLKRRNYLVLSVSLISILLSATALSKDYKVEVLVFENLIEHQAYESYKQKKLKHPDTDTDSDPDTDTYSDTDTDTEPKFWLIEPTMLLEEFISLEESEDYGLLHQYSWGQESLDYAEAAIIELFETELSGLIKVYANQLLYINLDLDYKGYRLTEKRRIRLDEKHFFDHPKFGILMQVSRLEEEEEEEEEIDSELDDDSDKQILNDG